MSRSTFGDVWRRFRLGGELRPLVCLAATVAVLLLMAGLGVCGGWLYGMTHTHPVPAAGRVGYVQPAHLRFGALVGGTVWLLALFWLWRPAVHLNRHSLSMEQRREWGRPIMVTALIGAGMVVASYVVNRQPWDAREWAVTGLGLVAGGVACLAWLPTIFGLERARPVTGPGGRVNVHCVECGYSMVGLRETACPECGRVYTVDELIREQGYEA